VVDRGQIEGGFLQGVGWLTIEELLWDDTGRLATAGASTYKLPSWSELPDVFNVDLLPRAAQPDVVMGSKAVGEPPLMLAISVREALRDAVGAFGSPVTFDSPATPERIFVAIRSARGDGRSASGRGTRTTLDTLNTATTAAFVAAVGWVFEHSPWVAERAAPSRPFETLDALHAAMTSAVASASRAEQLALLRAHPDLGTRARMSDASRGEQSGAGLDALSADEFDRLQALNSAYREKFGFPFLFAVKSVPRERAEDATSGRTATQILTALADRLPRSRDEERAQALQQVSRIARIRLEEMID
jgi:OHCU decarboxylase